MVKAASDMNFCTLFCFVGELVEIALHAVYFDWSLIYIVCTLSTVEFIIYHLYEELEIS